MSNGRREHNQRKEHFWCFRRWGRWSVNLQTSIFIEKDVSREKSQLYCFEIFNSLFSTQKCFFAFFNSAIHAMLCPLAIFNPAISSISKVQFAIFNSTFFSSKFSLFSQRCTLRSEIIFGNRKPFKNSEKCFLFHLKSFFRSQDISLFVLIFLVV